MPSLFSYPEEFEVYLPPRSVNDENKLIAAKAETLEEILQDVPEVPGYYYIWFPSGKFYIGGSSNLKKSLKRALSPFNRTAAKKFRHIGAEKRWQDRVEEVDIRDLYVQWEETEDYKSRVKEIKANTLGALMYNGGSKNL